MSERYKRPGCFITSLPAFLFIVGVALIWVH